VLHLSWACDDNEEEEELLAGGREDPEDYYAYAYGFTPETWRTLYQQPTPRARVPGDSGEFLFLTFNSKVNLIYFDIFLEYSGLYEGRTPSRLHTLTNPLKSVKSELEHFSKISSMRLKLIAILFE
jgi:hypothetical protein